MPRLGSFWAEHPAIELSLNPSIKSVDLVAGDMDLAMRFGKDVWPGLYAEKLVGAGYCIIGQPALMPTLTLDILEVCYCHRGFWSSNLLNPNIY